jgi:ATP-binding cassette subfamily F protein 3
VNLVKFLVDPPNILLMDEPTTHLDIWSIEGLILALQRFEGTLVFISHDVHFIKSIATKVLHINAGQVTPYAGGYDYYLEKAGVTEEDARAAVVAAGGGRESTNCKAQDERRAGGRVDGGSRGFSGSVCAFLMM